MYNSMMLKVVEEIGGELVDNRNNFPSKNRRLWSSKDSVHLSTDYGVPRLLEAIAKCIARSNANDVRTHNRSRSIPFEDGFDT